MPFQLDSLLGLPRYVFPSSFQSVCDDKSGYDHVLLSPVTPFLSDGNRLPIFTIL